MISTGIYGDGAMPAAARHNAYPPFNGTVVTAKRFAKGDQFQLILGLYNAMLREDG